jgi:two-component system, cell cycle response regulator
MTARIVVVDDIVANVRLLEAKLSAEYFEVVTAMNGLDALEAIQRTKPDIVLLDVMMPGMDGFEVCKRIKSNPTTQHIPVIMVTALDQAEDRVRGLEAGADDFLTKPVNDISLFCRIKSLVRLKMLTDELRVRTGGNNQYGLMIRSEQDFRDRKGKVMLVDPKEMSAERIVAGISSHHEVTVVSDPEAAAETFMSSETGYELVIVSFDRGGYDGLRLCSQLRSMDELRHVPILIVVDHDEQQRVIKALDIGINDYLMRPLDRQEMLARVNTQVRRWRYTQQLRDSVKASIELAVTDPLTGLYNRRYLETHLNQLVEHATNRGKALSLIVFDLDHFKSVNDTHGHDAGDKVLSEFAARLKTATRNIDLACRVGGEEFVLILPGTDILLAERIGERIRKSIANSSFAINDKQKIAVTVSAGIASLLDSDDTSDKMMKRADESLYIAKREGRNRIVYAA